MKVLVFGGNGFLGSHVCEMLIHSGYEVSVFDKKSKLNSLNINFIEGDILNFADVSAAIGDHHIVYNFAGISDLNYSIENPVDTIELNVMGNTHILQGCVKHKIQRFVYASTVYVYSDEGSFYGVSKKASEKIIEEYASYFGLNYTIIRYGSVYGNGADEKNRIFRIIKEALTERKIEFPGDGKETREYIHVKDAARLSIDILQEKFINQNLVLTGVERFDYSEVLNMINEILGGNLKISYGNKKYKGHYYYTPYSFSPSPGKKIVANPYIDFGQGILEIIKELDTRFVNKKGSYYEDNSAHSYPQ